MNPKLAFLPCHSSMPYHSLPVDTSALPSCFTHLPVRIHRGKEEIQRHTLDFVDSTKGQGAKAHKHASYRHTLTGPDMNVYALSWCEGELDRVKLVVEFIELLWQHDDVMEEVPLREAVAQGEKLRRAMYEEHDSEPVADNHLGMRVKRFRDICRRMKAIDAIAWVEVQEDVAEWLLIDTQLKEWDSVEEYLDLRKIHVGNNTMTSLIRWSMGIHLSKDELEFIKPYTDAVGVWYGAMNDFLSWKRERAQPTDRVMNVVHLIMKMYNLPEDVAIDTARGILVKEEGKLLWMTKDLHDKAGLSTGLRAYIESLGYYAGGWFYWCLLAPRNTKPQSFDI
ncbi:hypothetical protein NMY22_g7314 [Coprinellus aureogranulatus]|nr:hypothetical protein NMY22_g7314 [Coprinellus aureogranulatus]